MQISRRGALLGATAAAVVTGVITVPLANKAAGVKKALAGDPVLPVYEAFEAARLEYVAINDHIHTVGKAVKAELPPEPGRGRNYRNMSAAERDEAHEWWALCHRRTTARLDMDEDDLSNAYSDRMYLAYEALADIQATTIAGLLCQVRAWWNAHQDTCDTEVPKPDPEASHFDPEVIVQRLYHDVERLSGGLPS